MQYNSKREDLIIPAYGRHVQRLIEHIKNIEDKEKRQKLAEGMVSLMMQMNPNEKRSQEYSDKLWAHLIKISNYELDVQVPESVSKDKMDHQFSSSSRKVEYPRVVKKYRHYGQYTQDLIEKALEMEEGEKRQEFVRIIGSYMKTAYKQWNRDHYVNDESVLEDIKIITEGQLSISEDAALDYIHQPKSNSRSSNNRYRKTGNNNRNGSYPRKGKPNKQYTKKRKHSY